MDFRIDLDLQDVLNGDEVLEELQYLTDEPLTKENLPRILDYHISIIDDEMEYFLWKANRDKILEILLDNYF